MAPKDADIDVTYLWDAKIIGLPAETFDNFIIKHVGLDALAAVNATAKSSGAVRRKAIDDAIEAAVAKGADREILNAPLLDFFSGEAATHAEARAAGIAEIDAVADTYLLKEETA